MNSMTGYGSHSFQIESCPLSFEFTIQSVNRKNLDFQIYVPQEWSNLEQKLSEWVKGRLVRGRILIHLKISTNKKNKSGFNINHAFMDQTIQNLKAYSEQRNIPLTLDSELLVKLSQLIKDQEILPDWNDHSSEIKAALESALNSFESMRKTEGEKLKQDLCARMEVIKGSVSSIKEISKSATNDYSKALRERLKSMNLEIDIEDDRVLKEIALYADRSDITEEIIRLESHFEQFNTFLESDTPNGRKLDFLCIEIFRELNTISSKTQQIKTTRIIIESKNELERIREQVQNIE